MKRYSLKTTLLLLVIMFTGTNLYALPSLGDFLSPQQINDLNEDGEITAFYFGDTKTDLMPKVSQSQKLSQEMEDLGANFSIEGLFFIPQESKMNDEEELLNIMNLLCSASSLQGLEYYSASREKMRLLFEECWRVDDEENPLDDLNFTSLPEQAHFTIHQKDLTFGKNLSQVSILAESDSLYMSMKNLTNMKYNGFLKVISKGNFQTGVLVIPVEEGILYYGNMSAKTVGLKFIVEKASNSFYNRMKALFNWFSGEYQ